MASDIFLYRKDRRWQKFSKIDEVTLTGAQTTYSGVTGVDSTDILTLLNSKLENGNRVYFSSLTGGSSLAINTNYFVVNKSGNTFQLAASVSGSPLSLGSDITNGTLIETKDEVCVWSGEFRDQFNSSADGGSGGSASSASSQITNSTSAPNLSTTSGTSTTSSSNSQYPTAAGSAPAAGFVVRANVATGETTITPTNNLLSDEAAHVPLRQTLLKKTHWRFRQANNALPQYLYAVWADGDQISNSPPETE